MNNKGIKARLKELLKRNRFLYKVYYYIMSGGVNFLKLFLKTDERLILFVSFGGRRCADSPRAIYDYMLADSRFEGYKLVWGVINTKDYPEIKNKIKIDTLEYFKTALKARCWVTNVLIERSLSFKGINTFYLYTGHGSPIKKVGCDFKSNRRFTKLAKNNYDASLAQSSLEKEVRGRVMGLSDENVIMSGTPANDILATYSEEYRNKIRHELGIPDEKKAVLYAPTFREYNVAGKFETGNVDFKKWHNSLGDDYVILYRAHPITTSSEDLKTNWFIDVTDYNSIEPLMIASDYLVSDYSGLIADYSILHNPIFLWLYDYEQYEKARGLYFDLREALPYSVGEDKLLAMIKGGYNEEQKKQLIAFQKEYAPVYGSGTENAVELICKRIGIE